MKEIVLGIGNRLKSDDGVGIYIAERINKHLTEDKKRLGKAHPTETEVIGLDCGTTPENHTSTIRKQNPDKLILVDAADMGLSPASYRIIPAEKMEVMHFSTHSIPLSVFISYVNEFCSEVILIGIQPQRMDFGGPLSNTVKKSADQIATLIKEERLNEIETLRQTTPD